MIKLTISYQFETCKVYLYCEILSDQQYIFIQSKQHIYLQFSYYWKLIERGQKQGIILRPDHIFLFLFK